MTVGGNTLYFAYDASGTPLSVTYNGTNYYYATNLQGDVTAILNTSGTAVVQYTYDAWGNILTTTGSMASTLGTHNPLRYRGYVYDTETALYYLQSRYYNPGTGRFINADALIATGQGLLGNNMFAYCRNNPVRRKDVAGYVDENCIDGNPSIDDDEVVGGPGTSSTGSDYVPVQGQTGTVNTKSGTQVNPYPNPHGRKGGPAHQNVINQIVEYFSGKKGFSVSTEYKINTPEGQKPYRYADVYVKGAGYELVFRVGRGTQAGYPIARERYAISDIISTGYYMVCFVQYN